MYKKQVRFNDVVWLVPMKMRLKMKNRSQRHKLNRLGLEIDTKS